MLLVKHYTEYVEDSEFKADLWKYIRTTHCFVRILTYFKKRPNIDLAD